MANRITEKMLAQKVDTLNNFTGQPREAVIQESSNGTLGGSRPRWQPGAFMLDYANGGVALVRVVTEGGAVRTVLERGTKREIFDGIGGTLYGYRLARREV